MKTFFQKHGCQTAAGLIILFYIVLSLYHLGSRYAPNTGWRSSEKGSVILLDLGEEKELGTLVWYLGNYENRRLSLELGSCDVTGDSVVWRSPVEVSMRRVYQWGKMPLKGSARFLRFTAQNQYTEIRELILTDQAGEQLHPVNEADYPELFDEEWMYPGRFSFTGGTVFDESVFARTAYEYLHGLRSFEDTHPPLGKLLIAAGIACFGMTPFGWRLPGVIAGALILLLIWLFGEKLFKSSRTSLGVLALFAFDFMHFTEGRLGQVDSFLVLFMLGMNYFLFCYGRALETERERGGWKEWKYLALSGACMGMAVSCKWSGLYGATGLALLWAVLMIKALKDGKITWDYAAKTAAVCCLFFLAVPAAIYVLSYIPYVPLDPDRGFWEGLFRNQVSMYRYHSGVSPYHDSASRWFQWPLSAVPVILESIKLSGKRVETLALLGNPALWWPGIPACFACLYRALDRRDGKAAFLFVSWAAPMLPWILISRSSFLYHYYPSLPFAALMLGLWTEQAGKKGRLLLGVCAAAAILLFVLFYPVIAGRPMDAAYAAKWLEWLPAWKFVP